MTSDMTPLPTSLVPSLDLTAAEALCRTLSAQLTEGAIILDGSAVENVSTPCLQVLAAAAATARDHNQQFRLLCPSAVLRAAITDLGLHGAIPFED